MRKIVNFLAGFLVGSAIGAGIALLFAPSTGTELQEKIQARVEEIVEEGQKAAAARQKEMESQLEAFKSGTPITIEVTTGPEA